MNPTKTNRNAPTNSNFTNNHAHPHFLLVELGADFNTEMSQNCFARSKMSFYLFFSYIMQSLATQEKKKPKGANHKIGGEVKIIGYVAIIDHEVSSHAKVLLRP